LVFKLDFFYKGNNCAKRCHNGIGTAKGTLAGIGARTLIKLREFKATAEL
jgi:hypothetical protein